MNVASVLAVVVAVVSLIVSGAALFRGDLDAASLRTEKLEIITPDGETVVTVGATQRGDGGYAGHILLHPRKGVNAIAMSVADDGGGTVSLRNSRGLRAVALGSVSGGEGFIAVKNRDARGGVTIASLGNGGAIDITNADGKRIAFLGGTADPDCDGILELHDSGGVERVQLLASEIGGDAWLSNSAGETCVSIGSTSAGAGILETYDTDGRVLVGLSVDTAGVGTVAGFRGREELFWELGSTRDGTGRLSACSKAGVGAQLEVDRLGNGRVLVADQMAGKLREVKAE